MKKQVLDVLKSTGLYEIIGERRFFSDADLALAAVYARAEYQGEYDPLRPAAYSDKFSSSMPHD
jgi:hypothetical protein